MRPEDRAVMNRLVEGQVQSLELLKTLDDALRQQLANNMVLLSACGALYAELSRMTGREEHLDEMLSRLTGAIEANPDSEGRVLQATDRIRTMAEAMNIVGK